MAESSRLRELGWRERAVRYWSQPSILASLTLVLMALGLALGHRLSERAGMEQLAAVAAERLELYAASLEAQLARYDYLPSLIAIDQDMMAVLNAPQDAALRQRSSRKLARINVRAGLGLIFIIDAQNRVVASSADYPAKSGAPADALMQRLGTHISSGAGQFFAADASNGSIDYFLIQSLQREGRDLGRVVAKLNLAPLEAIWVDQGLRSQGERLLVVDSHDVVIMSSVPEWKYHLLGHSRPELRQELLASGRYAGPMLAGLGIAIEGLVRSETSLVQVQDPVAEGSAKPGARHLLLAQERAVVPLALRLVTLSDPSEVWRHARYAAWGGAAVGTSIGLVALYLAFRRRAVQQLFRASEALQRAHAELERQVSERTHELRGTNEELKHQISQRLKAEDELIQAGKLAVLGQMSAGLAHEINQPLTAMRALSRNSLLLLEKGRGATVAENLRAIDAMVERMGSITRQLKSFARKAEAAQAPVSLLAAIKGARLLLEHRIQAEQIQLHIEVDESLRVLCDGNRLEQVLVNLLGNALDAMQAGSAKQLRLSTERTGTRLTVRISDSGAGIPAALLPRLFEPFFTTKPAGQGLGLGLVISSKIVHEFGGHLRARPNPPPATGMTFEFDLEAIPRDPHV
ncbi:two-component system C4-dicarboxylate transport sensor histidine kinase DctB [Paucibacter oligotrophus]|uniref:C4-dicarboxylate transport sensor protein DctB n=1 Tax=Roseateles oligotrophus TaxID=1769250 RepID=A0A840L7W6_9BURK|nr:ATP-binding protein [Roseateles oligotrophus]MBB4841507.1 two-component system C4-dicarboxylate transport sensor histidine kinase DctB [Roseateles oligotrophus]